MKKVLDTAKSLAYIRDSHMAPTKRSKRLKNAQKDSLEVRRRVYCARHGHSKVHDFFFGYHYCARCEAQLGDSLGGFYQDDEAVLVHHANVFVLNGTRYEGCHCPENTKKLTKHDLALLPKYNSYGCMMRPPWKFNAKGLKNEGKQGDGAKVRITDIKDSDLK